MIYEKLGVILGVTFKTLIEMKISNASKEAIVPFIIGDNNELWAARTGNDLVRLFQTYGFRDDVYNGALPKLNNSNLNTSKTNYIKDRLYKITDINLKQLIEQLIGESANVHNAISQLNSILAHDNIKLSFNDGSIVWEGIKIDPKIENEAIFKDNEKKVIDNINSAKVSILVAMAWFTNEKIKEALVRKRQEDLRIELVIYKDGVNAAHGVDLTDFDYKEIRGTRGGFMHNKFCVIDNQKVLTGSYNWTTNAEARNDENVLVTTDNATATNYSVEFRRLKPLI